MVFRPFYAQKEFLRKILSLPDFEIRDSDDTQTIILENNIRPSSTFFVSGGYLRTVVNPPVHILKQVFLRKMEKNHPKDERLVKFIMMKTHVPSESPCINHQLHACIQGVAINSQRWEFYHKPR